MQEALNAEISKKKWGSSISMKRQNTGVPLDLSKMFFVAVSLKRDKKVESIGHWTHSISFSAKNMGYWTLTPHSPHIFHVHSCTVLSLKVSRYKGVDAIYMNEYNKKEFLI